MSMSRRTRDRPPSRSMTAGTAMTSFSPTDLPTALSMWSKMETMLFGPQGLDVLCPHVKLVSRSVSNHTDANNSVPLQDVVLLVTGWGSGPIGPDELDRMPNLQAIIHAAGSVKHHLHPEVWQRGIQVASCADENAIPVAEYTLAMILLAGKRALWLEPFQLDFEAYAYDPRVGNYARTIGIVGASKIGRRLLEMLRPFDFKVRVYDPYLTDAEARALGVTKSSLDTLAATSDVVSLHAPSTAETTSMIDSQFLAAMKPRATLINTARPLLIDTKALIEKLQAGDLFAILDVFPEDHQGMLEELAGLPNVHMTPHVAGAGGNEIRRLGDAVITQIEHFASHGRLSRLISAEDLRQSA